MSEIKITCPECGTEIKDLAKSYAAPLVQKAKKEAEREYEARLADARGQIAREAEERARKKAEEELAAKAKQADDLQKRLADMDNKLQAAQKEQAEMLKLKRELQDQKRELELTVEKRLAEEAEIIRQKARAEIESEHELKTREAEQQIIAMRKQIDDLKRRAEQGSQQHQGEILETALEELLRKHFPFDEIVEIKKGESGADVLQKVMSPNGKICGSILWEAKRTKNWSGSWISKLKNDQRAKSAEIAVLLSTALPKEMQGGFGQIDGVWVTSYETAISMAAALRMQLINVASAIAIRDGQKDKAELVYEYLTGTKFRHRVEAIVEKFSSMREDLQKEKKFMQKHWAKREGQIDAVISSTMGMYGDLEAIAGKSMPDIEGLDDDIALLE